MIGRVTIAIYIYAGNDSVSGLLLRDFLSELTLENLSYAEMFEMFGMGDTLDEMVEMFEQKKQKETNLITAIKDYINHPVCS